MMDRKPWENRDSHREGFGGRREWNSDRSDRRFGEDRPRFNREDRFAMTARVSTAKTVLVKTVPVSP